MRIALILPGNIWFAPYVKNYTRILQEKNVDFDIISWNRDGKDEKTGFQYQANKFDSTRSASLKEYVGYVKFIKRIIRKERFDRFIVFGPHMTCLLGFFLLFKKGKYIIDYRDLSIEQNIGFYQFFSFLLKRSYANVISSPGFKKCLPAREYFISHNFDVNAVMSSLNNNYGTSFPFNKDTIDVLTIGGIRDYSSNVCVIKALANLEGFNCRFVGKGTAEKQLESFCVENDIRNVSFQGFYRKEEEAGIIETASFLNIFYPRILTHDTAMSNRFYNSLIYKKPMIVTKGTTQGDYAEEFDLGIVIEDCSDLPNRLRNFLESDYSLYCNRCEQLLNIFLRDQFAFERMVESFINL